MYSPLFFNLGNMIRDDNSHISKIEYNYLHLPKQITKENFTQIQADGTQKMVQQENTYFHYTAAGQKLMYECKTTYADGTHLWTQIMYEGIVVYKGTSTNVEQAPLLEIDYIHHPEGRIRVSKVNQALQFTYEYHLKDHLGNTRVAFDAVQTGTSIFYKHAVAFQATDYYSFGMEHEQPNPYAPTLGQEHNQNFRYNGKEFYSGIGWSDYGARFYNSSLGRWMSIDPLAEKYMSLSTYHFSGNNPVNLIDRNGMSWESWHVPLKNDFNVEERNKSIHEGNIGFILNQIEEHGVQAFGGYSGGGESPITSKNEGVYETDPMQNNAPLISSNTGLESAQEIPTIDYQHNVNIPSVKQSKDQWCVFACAESLSIYYGKGTNQVTYANEFYKNQGIALNSNTPVSFGIFVGQAINYSEILGYTTSASAESIRQSLMKGNPVFTRGDFGTDGHAFIITGITGYSNGQIFLEIMNPSPYRANSYSISYQHFLQYQQKLTRPWAFSVSGVKY